MRSLSLKLTLAFLFISLIGIIVAVIIIQRRTRSEFDHFLYNQDRSEIVHILTQYYQENGNWEGVEVYIQQSRLQRAPMPDIPSQERWDYLFRFPLTLADPDGVIILGNPDRIGQQVLIKDLEDGIPLEIEGEVVGFILLNFRPPGRDFTSPETTFLQNLNQAVLISALIAVMIAFLLGITLARTLARPIQELTQATQVIAQGELGYQVEVRSKDELGQLATSFNQMSTDLAKENDLRKKMTADIAHDLRTPVSVILGYSEALSDGKLEGSKENYSIIHKEAGHLSRLIDDLRTISLADARELPLNLQQVMPASLIESSAMAFKPQAEQKQINLIVDNQPNLPLVNVDIDRMAQVLGNLVSNALRYTPSEGWIKLAATLEHGEILLQISDNGSGIAAEELPLVFTRFYRGDRSRPSNGEAGLGLTIAKALVDAQGGKIKVMSEPGEGTTFTIHLPSVQKRSELRDEHSRIG